MDTSPNTEPRIPRWLALQRTYVIVCLVCNHDGAWRFCHSVDWSLTQRTDTSRGYRAPWLCVEQTQWRTHIFSICLGENPTAHSESRSIGSCQRYPSFSKPQRKSPSTFFAHNPAASKRHDLPSSPEIKANGGEYKSRKGRVLFPLSC